MGVATDHGDPLAVSECGPVWWRRSEFPTADDAIAAQCDLEADPGPDLEFGLTGEWRVRLAWMRLADPCDYAPEWTWQETTRRDPRGVECWEVD